MATTKKTASKRAAKKPEKASSVYDYLRFGESYTSLVLGIIVVIIGTVLLLSLVRTRNITRNRNVESQITQNAAKTSVDEEKMATGSAIVKVDPTPTPTAVPTPTTKPTAIPTKKPTTIPTIVITKKVQPTATVVPTKKVAAPAAKPTDKPVAKTQKLNQGGTYIAEAGDNLWTIAEKTYKSGYNWVDVARANKLSNPDDIKVGQKIVLPKAEQKNATSESEWNSKVASPSGATNAAKITPGTYTIEAGDTLWDISVRAYGDGYQWVKLGDVNKLSNPDIIFTGAKLNIPQK